MDWKDDSKVIELAVQRGEPTLVPPADETGKGLYFLSNLDQDIAVIVRTIYCYKSVKKGNENVGEVIKDALSKILVHYYPLAGRLTTSSEMKLIVDCTGEGAVFVEAEADCEMGELGDIQRLDQETLGKLVYDVPGAKSILEIPPLVAQVRFAITCWGYALSLGNYKSHPLTWPTFILILKSSNKLSFFLGVLTKQLALLIIWWVFLG